MNLLGEYINGNYTVRIYDDGTKIRFNDEDSLIPSTVESMDIKITNKCDMGCSMCHENSTVDGLHGDIMSHSFIDNLHPWTELAIGGGNPLEHPDFIPFLEKCKNLNLIPSVTVNQHHFMKNFDLLKELTDSKMIYGLGISLSNTASNEFIDELMQIPNAVVHVINGIIHPTALDWLSISTNTEAKLLILGYKEFRRGKTMYDYCKSAIDETKQQLTEYLPDAINKHLFKVISFDNLAISQLPVRQIVGEKKWEEFYQGDDGSHTMYVDMVERKCAKTSTSTERYDISEYVEDMWNKVK